MTGPSDDAGGNVDKIREIIFGGQMREYDTRFSNLEQSIRDDANKLHSELRAKIDNTQNSLNSEITMIRQEVSHEAAERKKSLQEFEARLESQLKQITDTLLGTVGKVKEAVAKIEQKHEVDLKTLHSQIVEQSKFIYKDFQEKNNTLQSMVNAKTQSMEERMTDRSTLAEALRKIADGLSAPASPSQSPSRRSEAASSAGSPGPDSGSQTTSSSEETRSSAFQ